MGMTATETLLSRAAGRRELLPGQIITAAIDSAMLIHVISDITFPAFGDLATSI